MKEIEGAIRKLLAKEDSLSKDLNDVQKSIEALRKVCEHAWNYDGHGHNDDHYTCSICGDTKWE
jgi:hypothetical protein